MRQLRAARQPFRAVLLALAGAMLLFATGCETLSSLGGHPAPPGARKSRAEPLPLGSWKSDQIHCAADRCERWYEIVTEQEGVLKVDLYAPVGENVPDCEMTLETAEGEQLPARTGRVRTQRRLRQATEPATYYLRVAARGENRDRLDYDLFAKVDPDARRPAASPPPPGSEPAPSPPRAPSRKPRPEIPMAKHPPETLGAEPAQEPKEPRAAEPVVPSAPEPVPPPEPAPVPEPVWVVAEVLDVEEASGKPAAVMIEAGEPDGIREGMRGELVEDDVVIGRIEVVDVYPTGSRARIVGPLSAPVSFDTVSRIAVDPNVPPDGE